MPSDKDNSSSKNNEAPPLLLSYSSRFDSRLAKHSLSLIYDSNPRSTNPHPLYTFKTGFLRSLNFSYIISNPDARANRLRASPKKWLPPITTTLPHIKRISRHSFCRTAIPQMSQDGLSCYLQTSNTCFGASYFRTITRLSRVCC
jgi:hypothetical protein